MTTLRALKTGHGLPLAGSKPQDPYLSPPGSVPPATGPRRAGPTGTHMHVASACLAGKTEELLTLLMQLHLKEKATKTALIIVRLIDSDDLEPCHCRRQQCVNSQQR